MAAPVLAIGKVQLPRAQWLRRFGLRLEVGDAALDEVVRPAGYLAAPLVDFAYDARESQFHAQISMRPERTYFVDSLYKS